MALSTRQAKGAAVAHGVLTTLFGVTATVAPAPLGRAAGISDDAGLRVIGVTDLVVAAGLLTGRPRWPWAAARAALNVPTIAYFAALARRHDSRLPALVSVAIAAATLGDVAAARALRRARE